MWNDSLLLNSPYKCWEGLRADLLIPNTQKYFLKDLVLFYSNTVVFKQMFELATYSELNCVFVLKIPLLRNYKIILHYNILKRFQISFI